MRSHFDYKGLGKEYAPSNGICKTQGQYQSQGLSQGFSGEERAVSIGYQSCCQLPALDLAINWDQTGMHYIPVSSWTMAKEGVEICGIDDKRQITAVLVVL